MELAVGQYTRRGPIGALDKLCPILKGAGLGTVVISFFLCTYYNVILSWAMFYLAASFQSPLPWATCHNWSVSFPMSKTRLKRQNIPPNPQNPPQKIKHPRLFSPQVEH